MITPYNPKGFTPDDDGSTDAEVTMILKCAALMEGAAKAIWDAVGEGRTIGTRLAVDAAVHDLCMDEADICDVWGILSSVATQLNSYACVQENILDFRARQIARAVASLHPLFDTLPMFEYRN